MLAAEYGYLGSATPAARLHRFRERPLLLKPLAWATVSEACSSADVAGMLRR
jgi:hypothetical protein